MTSENNLTPDNVTPDADERTIKDPAKSGLDPELEQAIVEKEKQINTETFGSDDDEASKRRRIFAHNKAQNREAEAKNDDTTEEIEETE